jgi:hypothetical protein
MMDDSDENDQNESQALSWIARHAKPFSFTNDTFKEFINSYITNIHQIGTIPKETFTKSLIKIEESAIDSLRNDLSTRLLSTFTPLKGETLALKDKRKSSSQCADIFHITALLIDAANASISDMSVVYNIKRKNVSNEEIQEKLDFISNNIIEINFRLDDDNASNYQQVKSLQSINEKVLIENNNLKIVVETLNEKVESLNANINSIMKLLETNKTNVAPNVAPNTIRPFTFAAIANKNTSDVIVMESPSTNNIPKTTPIASQSAKRNNSHLGNQTSHNKVKIVGTNSTAQKRPQLTLTKFDSYKPHLPSVPMNEGNWNKTKQDKKKEKFTNKKKDKAFVNSIGTGSFEGLESVDRPHTVLIKRVDNSVDPDKIVDFLKNSITNRISDFKELQLPHQHFKAYTFSISFLKKSIINEKALWPNGWVVSSYYRPKTQSSASAISNVNGFNSLNSRYGTLLSNQIGAHATNTASNGSSNSIN